MTEQTHIRARKFLQEFFNDDELTTFCFDYFPQVYNDFTGGMPKNQKVLMLISHSQRRERFEELLAALERERPTAYQERFAEKPRLVPQVPQLPRAVKRNPRQIFISHASKEAEFAQRLAADLRANGWQTWIAPDNIKPGEKWVEAINRGLMESGVFVLLLTPEAVTSRWVQSEMNVAIGMEHRGEIRLFPLNVKPTATPALWGAYQWISFDAGYEAGLVAFLGELEPPEAPPPVVTRAPHVVLPEKSKPTPAPLALDAGLAGKAASQPPADLPRPNPLQAVVDQIKTMPARVLYGSGGVVVLLLLGFIFWPEPDVDPGVEPTEVAEVLVAEISEPEATKDTQPSENAAPTEDVATPTATGTPSPTETIPPAAKPSLTPTRKPTPTRTPTPTWTPTPTVDPNPPANAQLGNIWTRPSDGMPMVFVPGGTFMMGSNPAVDTEAYSDEMPQREVVLSSFWLDKFEVTNSRYSKCVSEGDCTASRYADDTTFNGATQPVVGVSWYDARDYCEWVGGALPTEAQWEYAARGSDGRIYPWGNTFDSTKANYCDKNCPQNWADQNGDDGYVRAAPVGSFSPAGDSWVGAADMAGNVWEWVADWFAADYYKNAPANNPLGPADGGSKVVRGGEWGSISRPLRVAGRGNNMPVTHSSGIGFRCLLPPG